MGVERVAGASRARDDLEGEAVTDRTSRARAGAAAGALPSIGEEGGEVSGSAERGGAEVEVDREGIGVVELEAEKDVSGGGVVEATAGGGGGENLR